MKRLRPRLLLPVLAVAAFLALFASLAVPYAGFQSDVFLDISKGTGTREIARMLQAQGVIRYQWQLLMVRVLRPAARLQAGEYRFSRPASVWSVFGRLARGDVFYYELLVPEGWNMFDVAGSLQELQVMPAQQFLRAARNPALIRDLAPRADSLEGYLFPATYHITRQMTAEQISKQMTDQFRRVWKELNAPPGADVHTKVTMASLVEKETAVPQERPLVASVYANRLRIGMKLDCDPTVIYAALLGDRYRGLIFRSDLDRDHPYNTYRYAGLPPGPIANPGRASLEAALRPAETDYRYFVARPGGGGAHQFSRQFEAHEQAVGKYRRARR